MCVCERVCTVSVGVCACEMHRGSTNAISGATPAAFWVGITPVGNPRLAGARGAGRDRGAGGREPLSSPDACAPWRCLLGLRCGPAGASALPMGDTGRSVRQDIRACLGAQRPSSDRARRLTPPGCSPGTWLTLAPTDVPLKAHPPQGAQSDPQVGQDLDRGRLRLHTALRARSGGRTGRLTSLPARPQCQGPQFPGDVSLALLSHTCQAFPGLFAPTTSL